MKSPNPGHAVNGFYKKTHCYTPCCGKMPIPFRHINKYAYMDYLELHFSEIMQYEVEKRIHFELIPTSTSRDELVNCQVNVVKDVSNQQEKHTWVYLKLNYSF